MQTTRRLAVLTVLAAVLIAAGALFLIAPVWQPQRPAAAYGPGSGTHCRAGGTDPHRHQHGHGGGTDRPAGPWPPEGCCARSLPRGARPFATLADAAAVKGISLRMTESWAGLAAANH